MTPYAELEIGLHHLQGPTYQVELRFKDPDPENAAMVSPGRGSFILDRDQLLDLALEPAAYGAELSRQLFHHGEVRGAYDKARATVDARRLEMRVRLLIGPTAKTLQSLRWELLTDPASEPPIAFADNERTPFSRFMLSADWRPIKLRPKIGLKGLIAISAPPNASDYKLAEVPVEAEVERATRALGEVEIDIIGDDEPLTLDELLTRLKEQEVDLLYVVCHGAIVDKVPHLFFQNDDGQGAWVDGEELARGVARLPRAPRLAVLASCQSAGTEAGMNADGEATSQSSLAPRLAEAGVPAVIAMQGNISMQTVEKAMPVFFQELLVDGQIDRAMAAARAAVHDRPDRWMPALYSRLKRGRIWYVPGFGGGDDNVRWQAIVNDIAKGRFTPIVGWGLAEKVYGSQQDLAHRLATAHGFPLAPHQKTDLARVAMYMQVDQTELFAIDAVKQEMEDTLQLRHQNLLEPEDDKLSKKVRKIGAAHRESTDDPYRIVAEMPARVFINATWDDLLEEALKAAGKKPRAVYAFWSPHQEIPESDKDKPPTVDSPLVYYLFGHLKNPDSLVLNEDNFFDYLIGTSANRQKIPGIVRHSLAASSLLFLGFQLTDWSFRVLFRMVMSQEGGRRRRDQFAHAAVQVDPEGGHMIDVDKARKYLERYYGDSRNLPVNIFWGTSDEFLKELQPKIADLPAAEMEDDDDDEY